MNSRIFTLIEILTIWSMVVFYDWVAAEGMVFFGVVCVLDYVCRKEE